MMRTLLIVGFAFLAGCSGLPSKPAEKSVKPGINEKFLDPDLDVDAFVKRFELESREVFERRNEILAACAIQPGGTAGP